MLVSTGFGGVGPPPVDCGQPQSGVGEVFGSQSGAHGGGNAGPELLLELLSDVDELLLGEELLSDELLLDDELEEDGSV